MDSAQRVNAGALMAQETGASLPMAPPPAPLAPTAPVQPKKEESSVRPVETYQGDIEKLVQNKNVSVVSIAAAEAVRRGGASLGGEQPAKEPVDWGAMLKRAGMIGGGVLLLAVAAGLILFVLQPARSVQVPAAAVSPFINVDATKVLTIPANNKLTHTDVVNSLNDERKAVQLSLGLMERLYIAESATTTDGKETLTPLTAQQVLEFLSPNVPDALARSVDPVQFLLGIHVYAENQPFLILRTDSYEQAYAAMLSWEPYMQQDLSPLFTRTPSVQLSSTPADMTTTIVDATTTSATTTDESAPPEQTYTAPAVFVDQIVENQDARVIKDANGNILLLWAFIGRQTLVVTNNEVTLREIISRLTTPPIVPQP